MKRRFLAFVVALAILLTSGLPGVRPAMALENELLITDCETLAGWTKTGGNALSVNINGFTGSAIHCDVTNGAFRTATYTAPQALDISGYLNLTWDAMFHKGGQPGMWEQIASTYGDEVYVKIGSSESDYNIYRLSKMTVQQDANKNTWYHFSVNLDDPSSTTGNFDPKAMTTFYFSTTDGAVNTSVQSGSIRLDNIYARNLRPVEPSDPEDLVFAECNTLDGWSYKGSSSNVTINPNGMPGNTVQVFTGYGALRELTYTDSIDLSAYNTIEFEMRVALASSATTAGWDELAAAYADTIGFEVSDGTAVNTYKLDKWKITALDNCWYHVSIDLDDPTSTTGKLDLSKFGSVTVYTVPTTGGALNNTLPNRNFRFDTFTAHYEPKTVLPPETLTVANADSTETGAWSYTGNGGVQLVERGGRTVAHVGANLGALRELSYAPADGIDLTGYGTLEWVMMVATGGTTDVFEEVAAAYKATAKVIVTDATHSVDFPLNTWQVGEVQNLYRSFAIDLSKSDLDLSKIVSITFTTVPTGSAAVASTPDAFIRVDEITASNHAVTPSGYGEQEELPETLPVADGTETGAWSYAGNGGVSLVERGGRTVAHVDTNLGALRELIYTPVDGIDLTGYSTLEWVMMIATGATTDVFEEVAAAYKTTAKVIVTDATHSVDFPLNTWQVGEVQNLYRSFAIDLSKSDLDLSKIVSITFTTAPTGTAANPSAPNAAVRVDEITATNHEVTPSGYGEEEPTGPIIISDGSSLENWTLESGTLLTNPDQGLPKPSMQVGAGFGALRKLTYTGNLDLTNHPTIEWDWFVMDEKTKEDAFEAVLASYRATTAVEISDGSKTVVLDTSKWELVSTDGMWRHFAVSLADSGLNLAEIKTVSFYTCPRDGGTPNTALNNMIYRFDNIYATDKEVTPNMGTEGPDVPTGPILISDGSSNEGWTIERGSLIINADNGLPAPSMQVGAGFGALRKLTYTGSLDLSKYPTIEWDWFVMDEKTKEDAFEAALASYRATTAVEISDGTTTVVLDTSKWELVSTDGMWRHFAVSLADSGLNLAEIKTVSFYTCPVDGGTLDQSLNVFIYRFDNIYATDEEVTPNMGTEGPDVPDDKSILISECETTENWSYEQPSQTLNSIAGRSGNAIQVFTGHGALRRITYTETAGRDFSAYHKIGFDFRFINAGTGADMWTTVENVYKNYIGVEIGDGTHTEKFKLSDMVVTALDGGWYHAELEVPSDSAVNLAKFATFTFYALPMGLGNPDTSLPNMNFRIDNLAAYESAGQPSKKVITSTYFSDGMMFQQNKTMNVFGKVDTAGKAIKAELLDHSGAVLETKECISQADGSWTLAFSARAGSYDEYSIKLYADGALTQVINDILIGELWLTAGQSNMEYYVIQAMPTYDTPIPTNPYVRFFVEPTVPGGVNAILPAGPADDIADAFWNDGSVGANAKYVSAIGYFMSLKLQEELKVPVGFIHAAKGASLIESWLPRSVIENNEVIKSVLEARGLYLTEEALAQKTANWTSLTTLYNSKIAPFAGVNIAGMLWYHGESNVKYADENSENAFYAEAFQSLIQTYSKEFGFENGGMPFVFAHLAPHDYSTAGGRAQDYTTILADFAEMLSETAAKTDAQVIQLPLYDLSLQYKDPPVNNPDPIHPNSKIELAQRFASAVLAGVYDQGNKDAQTAPTVASWKVEGNKIVLTYQNVGDGLKILNNSADLTGFAIAGSDRVFVKATAKIVGSNQIEVYSDAVAAPVAVTYAWTSFNMRSNLANSAGIPAVPYRTDKVASTYYLSMDWADFDSDQLWVATTTLDAGFQPAYTVSDNAALAVDTADKLEGLAAIRLNYTLSGSGTAGLSPVLSYHGMVNQYQAYTGLTVQVKNPDNRSKQLSLAITASGETYYATIITGDTLATSYDLAAGAYAPFTFNLARLVNAEGKVVADSTPVLKTMSALTICVSDSESGTVLFDSAYLRADKLPAPGSDGDVVDVEDTTPGSVDAEGNMWLNPAESANGWSATGTQIVVDTEKHTQGQSSVGAAASGGILKQIVYVPGMNLDISAYDYLEFDVYFSNMKWFDGSNMMFEMTSSGGPDVESNRWMKGQMSSYAPELYNAAVAGTDQPGWYHVKLTIASPQGNGRGSMDLTRFNFFRFYSIGAPAGTPDYEVRFDNMKFTKKPTGGDPDDPPVVSKDPAYGKVIDDTSMWLTDGETMGYWQATGTQVLLDTTKKTQGSSSVSVTAAGGILRQIAYVSEFSIDISGYQYLEFDAYFTNLDWYFAGDSTMFELTSSGTSDKESSRFTKSSMLEACAEFAQDVEAGKGGGKWYHFKFRLDAPRQQVNGGLDKTRFNFFRFYTVKVAEGTPDYTLYLDDLRFTKDPEGPTEVVKDPSYGTVIDGSSMWLTNGDYLAFWRATGADVLLASSRKTQGNSSVSVTAKNGILKQIAFVPDHAIDVSAYQYLEFDIYFTNLDWYFAGDSTMFELTSAGTSDIESSRFTKSSMLEACPEFAADVAAGKGGGKWYHFKLNLDMPHAKVKGGLDKTRFNFFRFYSVQLPAGTPDYTLYLDNLRFTKGEPAPALEKTDEHIIINNCDSSAGWSSPGQEVMVDQSNKVSGAGSVTVTAKGGILKELVYRPAEPIDLTGYRYLQFDLFLSDISCLNTSTGFMVELTSSGTCDVASNRYLKSMILLACPELAADLSRGEAGNKWYHFCFDLDKPQNQARGGLDMTAFNYFRIYFIGSPAGTPDCVVKLDNLKVTKTGVSTPGGETPPQGGGQIVFPSGGSPGPNIGNKVNGGLKGNTFEPLSDSLVTAVAAMGGVVVLLLAATLVLLILSQKKKTRRTRAR